MELTHRHQRTTTIRQGAFAGIRSALALCFFSVATFYLFDSYTHNPFTSMNFKTQVLNMVFYLLLAVLLVGIFRRLNVALMVESGLFMVIGLANYYVLDFRSAPIMPWDIYSLQTAASVAGDFDYSLSKRAAIVLVGFLLLMVLESRCKWKLPKWKALLGAKRVAVGQGAPAEQARIPGKIFLRAALVLLPILLIWGYGGMIQSDSFVASFGLYDKLFTPTAMCRRSGNAVAFIMELEYLHAEKPQGYHAKQIEEYFSSRQPAVESSAGVTGESQAKKQPNLIVIMNEAFSDLAALGEFETNMDYMPYLHSLQQGAENTITGTMHVSVLGGNTANTEFEFLTGNTMAFLPNGSVPYQQYINDETPSLASHLKEMGYQTVAMHPYYASGWERDEVYPWLGFDQFLSNTAFAGKEKIRQYYSDRACYERIQKIFSNKGDSPLFLFNVTMQNHSGYTTDFENFTPEVEMEGQSSKSLNTYLSLVKESDEALRGLIEYFSEVEEDTMVVFFGDHQPTKSVSSPILRANAGAAESVEEGDYYQVPYLIWANFDIEEKTGEETSPNYLGIEVLRQCGMQLPAYWEAVAEIREEYPVISAIQVKDAEGNSYEVKELKEELNFYQQMQYYMLFE